MNVEIIQANVDDAPELLILQQIVDHEEARSYSDSNIPPLTQTLSELQKEFETSVFVKAIVDGRIVGSLRGKTISETCMIGRLVVHPEFQGNGIRISLMQSIEVLCPSARRFELLTDTMSADDIRLYEELGYVAYCQSDLSPQVPIICLEKTL